MAINKRLIRTNDEGGGASFNTVLYTGNGTTLPITGVGFQPDLVWLKRRDAGYPYTHKLIDSVRGATIRMSSEETGPDITEINGLKSFDSDGFTLGGDGGYNVNNASNVAWNWKGAEIPAINSNGSIPSVVSANPAAGFSIVSYTGNGVNNSTFGHGISGIDMIIIKNRDAAENWATWHSSLPSVNSYMYLDSTQATNISTEVFRGVSSSTVTVGTHPLINANNNTYIAYCFAEVAGFSKFGSYVGIASGNVTVNCGFEPAFVMVKCSSHSSTNWEMLDNKRNLGVDGKYRLRANDSSADAGFNNSPIKFTSTGFYLDSSVTGNSYVDYDANGRTYIYMAFANQF